MSTKMLQVVGWGSGGKRGHDGVGIDDFYANSIPTGDVPNFCCEGEGKHLLGISAHEAPTFSNSVLHLGS